jgi:hypothetical protein
MGWFNDKSGIRDGIYDDEDAWLDANRDGYTLTDRREGRKTWGRDKRYGPLKEDEMIDLLDEMHFPNRKQIKIAIHEHAEDYPRYRSEKIARSRGKVSEQKSGNSGSGCGCLTLIIIIILVFAYIGATSDDSESGKGQNPGASQAISHVLKIICLLT